MAITLCFSFKFTSFDFFFSLMNSDLFVYFFAMTAWYFNCCALHFLTLNMYFKCE